MTDRHYNKIKWRCRRGMKELDILFNQYINDHYLTAPSEEQQQFEQLLTFQDPVLYSLVTGRSKLKDTTLQQLIEKVRSLKSGM